MDNPLDFTSYAIKLSAGDHKTPQEGMCIMECVAYITGENHTDRPKCACPVITEAAIRINDNCKNEDRQSLIKYVLRIAGSKSTEEVEIKRQFMILDCVVRRVLPEELRDQYAGIDKRYRSAIENFVPIVDKDTTRRAYLLLLQILSQNVSLSNYSFLSRTLSVLFEIGYSDPMEYIPYNLVQGLLLRSLANLPYKCYYRGFNIYRELLEAMLQLTDETGSKIEISTAEPKLLELARITA